MIKKILYILLFVVIAIAIAIFIKPSDDELVYVYEKAEKREELKEKYDVLIEKNPEDKKLQVKQLENLEKLQDNEYINYLIDFYEKNKTKENITKIIDHYKANEDYEAILQWYEKEYKEFDTLSSVDEIIKLSSFIKKKDLQIVYLKEKYKRTDERAVLFDLYNIGEDDFALTELKKIALETEDKQLIFTLYGLNEREFSLDVLKEFALKNKLKNEEYLKTIELLIYEKQFEDSLKLYKRKKLKDLKVLENIDLYLYLLQTLQNKPELKKLYKYAYKETSKDEYFYNIVNMYLDDTDIDTSIDLYKMKYKKTNSLEYLEDIIYLYYTNDNQKEYLKHLEIKALRTKDIVTLQYVLSEYLDIDDFKSVNSLLEKIKNLTPGYDEYKEIYLLTLVHIHQKEKAKKEFIRYMPENPSANVIYSIYDQKMNEISMPYFMKVLKDSRDEDTKSKLFKYRYKTLRLFNEETFKIFGQANTYKKLTRYMHGFQKKDKIKNYLKFAKKSKDPMFLADIGFFFIGINDYKHAKDVLTKANTINPENLYVLDYLAQVYTIERDYSNALALLNKYNEVKPNDPIINYRIGEILYAKNNIEESAKFYRTTIGYTKIENFEDKALILKSKARLGSSLESLEKEYTEVIAESNYNKQIINEHINLYIEQKEYTQALSLIEKYKNRNDSQEFKIIEINALAGLGKFDDAKKMLKKLIEVKGNKNNMFLFEQLGFLNLSLNKKQSAIKAFDKSIKLGSKNKELIVLNNELKKKYRHSVGFKAGIRNEIKEAQIKATYVHENLFKVSIQDDIYEKYNSAKILFEDLDEKYILGAGKDYVKAGVSNLFNSTRLSLFFEKSIDTGTKKTIADELIYDRYNFTLANSIEQILFYNASFDYYKYDKFRRKRFTASVYYPFAKNYFTTLSYIYEDVDKANDYGYNRINAPSITIGRNYKVNNNFSYLTSLGAEFKDGNVNALSNLDFAYKNKDMDVNWNNGFAKDNFTDEYTFTSLFYFTYFY